MMTPSFQAKIAEKLDDQGSAPSPRGEGRDEQVLRTWMPGSESQFCLKTASKTPFRPMAQSLCQ